MSQGPDDRRAQVLATCAQLPAAELTHPFGEQTAVYKVGGKMFAAVGLDGERPQVTLKCEPGYAAALVADHDDIAPGYHMDKRHWITVTLPPAIAHDFVDDLVTDSYDLVVDGLPARARPPARDVEG